VATDKPRESIDLRTLNTEHLEALFPCENPGPKQEENETVEGSEGVEDEFEIHRKQFFGR
jgi:hypothetical protein